jgi:hypothetical protein
VPALLEHSVGLVDRRAAMHIPLHRRLQRIRRERGPGRRDRLPQRGHRPHDLPRRPAQRAAQLDPERGAVEALLRPRARHLPAPRLQRRERGLVDLLLLELEGVDAPEVLGPRRRDLVRQDVLGLPRGALIEVRLRAPQVLREAAAGVLHRRCNVRIATSRGSFASRRRSSTYSTASAQLAAANATSSASRREGSPGPGFCGSTMASRQAADKPGGRLQVGPQRAQVVGRRDLPGDLPALQQVVEQRRQPHEHQRAAQPDLTRDRELHEPTSALLERAIPFARPALLRNSSIASGAAIPAAASVISVPSAF